MSRVLSLVFLVLLSACGSSALGNFDSMGFVHERYPYTVDYQSNTRKEIVNSDWRLDNFYWKEGKLTPKGGNAYELTTRFDVDGDGTYEVEENGYAYDLKLEHVLREQTNWLRSLPIDASDERKNLDVLMRDYVDAVAGTGYATVSLTGKALTLVERRFATEMVGQQALKLAGRDALLVVFDVANVDQLSVNQQDRTKRVALLFVRSGFKHMIKQGSLSTPFPVIMVAGYASHPADFDRGLGAFEYFVSRIMLRASATRAGATDEEVRKASATALNLPAGSVAALVQAATPAAAPASETAPAATTPAPADETLVPATTAPADTPTS